MTKIKVCGMRSGTQVSLLADAGADFAGLIFYPLSKRFVGELDNEEKTAIKKTGMKKFGVFVNEEIEVVEKAIEEFDLFAIQLHGDELPEYCIRLRKNIHLVKVFRLQESWDVDDLCRPFMNCADYFLFDNGSGNYGGTGKKFNWQLLKDAHINKPFFLSGGIGPGDAEVVREFEHPFFYGIDINSRFEISPGEKDLSTVRSFINELKKDE